MAPDIFVDWNAPEGEQVTVPIGLGLWHSRRVDGWPLRIGAEVLYSVIKPDFIGQEWTLRLQITPQIPYPKATPITP